MKTVGQAKIINLYK